MDWMVGWMHGMEERMDGWDRWMRLMNRMDVIDERDGHIFGWMDAWGEWKDGVDGLS
jgi:hypothetical protein